MSLGSSNADGMPHPPHSIDGAAFQRWRDALLDLTASDDRSAAWRRHRYAYAHRLGAALVGVDDSRGPVQGPAVYGVWLQSGLLYVGQTSKAQRRLRDLPVGESHHLANSFPPEIWHRVAVISWSLLPEAKALLAEVPPDHLGLALEHRLQTWLLPLVNSERRTAAGGWSLVDRSRSTSRGARLSERVNDLFLAVQPLWEEASRIHSGAEPSSTACRVVFPEQLQ